MISRDGSGFEPTGPSQSDASTKGVLRPLLFHMGCSTGLQILCRPGQRGAVPVGPALHQATVRVGATGPAVSPDVLMSVAEACRRHERLRFDYNRPSGAKIVREVEPHSLVSFERRWYLVALDFEQEDWRTYWADRMRLRTPTGPLFTPREPPEGDVATYLSHQLSSRTWPYQAVVRYTSLPRPWQTGYGTAV